MNIHNISKNMKKFRNMKNALQSDVSKLIGISVAYYSEIERGIKIPTLETFIKITKVLGVMPTNLLLDDGEKITEKNDLLYLSPLVTSFQILTEPDQEIIKNFIDTYSYQLTTILRSNKDLKESKFDCGNNIRYTRLIKKITLQDMCDMIGLSHNYYTSIEKNYSTPKMETFMRIVNALDTTPNELLIHNYYSFRNELSNIYSNFDEKLTEYDCRLILETANVLINGLIETHYPSK